MVIIFAVRAADQRGAAAGNGLDLVAAGLNIRYDPGGAETVIVVVVIGMAHDLMARVVERLYRFRVFVHPVPHHEKGGFHVVFRQNINEVLGILVAPR